MAGGYSLLKKKVLRWKLITMKAVATFAKLIDVPDEMQINHMTEDVAGDDDHTCYDMQLNESSDEEPSDSEDYFDYDDD